MTEVYRSDPGLVIDWAEVMIGYWWEAGKGPKAGGISIRMEVGPGMVITIPLSVENARELAELVEEALDGMDTVTMAKAN